MFEKSTIEAYRQVTAPAGLKARVVSNDSIGNAKVAAKRLYKTLSVMAACLVLIFSATAFENRNHVSVLFGGEKLTGEPVVLSAANDENDVMMLGLEKPSGERTVSAKTCISLELEASQEMTISVSAGELAVFDAETGESLSGGTAYQQMAEQVSELNMELAKNSAQEESYTESAENSASDESYTVSGRVLLDWYVENGQEAKLHITSGNKESNICLCYDKTDGAWVIFQE